jgi:hypothetical protein
MDGQDAWWESRVLEYAKGYDEATRWDHTENWRIWIEGRWYVTERIEAIEVHRVRIYRNVALHAN